MPPPVHPVDLALGRPCLLRIVAFLMAFGLMRVQSATPSIDVSVGLEGKRIEFSFTTESGTHYELQYSPVLNNSSWEVLTTLQGNGGVQTVTDPIGPSAHRFYRLRAFSDSSGRGPVPGGITTVAESARFLYTGENPVQTNVIQGAMDDRRAAIVRGQVLDGTGLALQGVEVSIMGHPELGQTLAQADGQYDLVVNGGGYLSLNYRKPGYLPAQRTVQVPWQDFVVVEPVILLNLDPKVTTIDLANAHQEFQIALGSVVTDEDGTRQAAVLFPPRTQAEMILPDGSRKPLGTLNVRATEYTVGTNGPWAMPGELPPTTGYTYAVELSADEAVAAGARSVEFSQPIPLYVDNFLGLPTGIQVPTAYYDRDLAAWVPIDDGKVISIVSIENGEAQVDSTGDGLADNGITIGMDRDERRMLAQQYTPQASLQRVLVRHFTPYDLNFGVVPASGAVSPQNRPPIALDDLPENQTNDESNSICGNSTIDCQNQRLREFIPVAGTSLRLSYASDRAADYQGANTLLIPLSGPDVPGALKRIDLEISVAGRRFVRSFPAAGNLTHVFQWDGKNSFGMETVGKQAATLRIGYVYDGFYALPPNVGRTFGFASGAKIPGDIPARQNAILWQSQQASLGSSFKSSHLGGWGLSILHYYDAIGGRIYLGSGQVRTAAGMGGSIITTVAGSGQRGFGGDRGAAVNASMASPSAVATAADGKLYIADRHNHRIRQVDTKGVITTIAGTVNGFGEGGFRGDGGPAISASLQFPWDLAVASDGALYVADFGNNRIRRIGPDGIISTVAGNGQAQYSEDGQFASTASLYNPLGVTVDRGDTLYIAEGGPSPRVRRVSPDGILTTVDRSLQGVAKIAIGPDGSLYFAHRNGLSRMSPDGQIMAIAKTEYSVDSVAITPRGQLLFSAVNRVTGMSPSGEMINVAGDYSVSQFIGDGGLATRAVLAYPNGIAAGPDGSIYIADLGHHRIRRVSPALPEFGVGDVFIPSENSEELHQFSSTGKHLRTLNATTGAVLSEFLYDPAGLLVQISDGTGNHIRVERNSQGQPTAIVAPFGQRTTLSFNAVGQLVSVTNPSGETFAMSYTPGGQLTSFSHPRGYKSTYQYDDLGRLVAAHSPDLNRQTLSRNDEGDGDGFAVTRVTALERRTSYLVEPLPIGGQRRITTFADGTRTTVTVGSDGRTVTSAPDGMLTDLLEGPDPRFSMQAPIPQSVKVTTGGLTSTTETARSVDLATPGDPLSLIAITNTVRVNGRTFQTIYTATNRTTVAVSPAMRRATNVIDEHGRPISLDVPGMAHTSFTYDSRGRLESLIRSDGVDSRRVAYAYDPQGYLHRVTDPLGRSTEFARDPVGRVLKQTLPGNRELSFTFDANGNLLTLTPPGKPAHAFTYTVADLPASYDPPALVASAPTVYEYNADRQVRRVTLPSGETLNYEYDFAGRLASLTMPHGEYRYRYLTNTGQMASIIGPDGLALGYTYNGALLTDVTQSNGVPGSVHFAYDNDFRVREIQVNRENPVTYGYDPDGLLIRAGPLALTYDRDNGLLTGTTLENVKDSYRYNAFGELASYRASYNESIFYEVIYTRDRLGRITRKVETVLGKETRWDYTYDEAGRLGQVERNGILSAVYTYDANGNRLSKSGPGINEVGTYDSEDRLLSYGDATYTYTSNGELRTKGRIGQATTYDYDAFGNLRRATLPDGTRIEYLVDGQNRRIGKKINGVLTQGFIYQDQVNPVAEVDGNGNIVSQFVYTGRANAPAYMFRNAKTYRYILDHLGSPRLVVDAETGEIVQDIEYDDQGVIVADPNPGFQPFAFVGGIHDADIDLVRLGARDYEGSTGRWTTRDPALFKGGDSNLYGYGFQNPVDYVDTTGLAGRRASTYDIEAALMGFRKIGPKGHHQNCLGYVGGTDQWINDAQFLEGKRMVDRDSVQPGDLFVYANSPSWFTELAHRIAEGTRPHTGIFNHNDEYYQLVHIGEVTSVEGGKIRGKSKQGEEAVFEGPVDAQGPSALYQGTDILFFRR